MKYITLIIGLLVVGCGKTEPMGSGNEYNAELAIDQNTTEAEPVKELTLEEKQKALRDSVVGGHEHVYKEGGTQKWVFLEDGVYEWYEDGKKQLEDKWSISNGEIHAAIGSKVIAVWRINPDKSITWIAEIQGGKRTDRPKEHQTTFKKIK